MNRTNSRFWFPYLAALLIACLGCVVDNNATNSSSIGDGTDVSGTVGGQSFSVASGSAEPGLNDTYVITLADTPAYSCTAENAPPMNYLQVVIGEVDGPGTFDADGRVFFNVFADGVSEPDAADSGTVTIDVVDRFDRVIAGSIDASGPESNVSGDFSVEICSN